MSSKLSSSDHAFFKSRDSLHHFPQGIFVIVSVRLAVPPDGVVLSPGLVISLPFCAFSCLLGSRGHVAKRSVVAQLSFVLFEATPPAGRKIRNVVPTFNSLSTEIFPPWASTMVLHWKIPMPRPCFLVV